MFLFKDTNTSKKKIKRGDYLRRLADEEELDIIEQETGDDCGAKAAGAGEFPSGKQEKITENTAPSGTSEIAAMSEAANACDSSSMNGSAATGAPSSPRYEAKDKLKIFWILVIISHINRLTEALSKVWVPLVYQMFF